MVVLTSFISALIIFDRTRLDIVPIFQTNETRSCLENQTSALSWTDTVEFPTLRQTMKTAAHGTLAGWQRLILTPLLVKQGMVEHLAIIYTASPSGVPGANLSGVARCQTMKTVLPVNCRSSSLDNRKVDEFATLKDAVIQMAISAHLLRLCLRFQNF